MSTKSLDLEPSLQHHKPDLEELDTSASSKSLQTQLSTQQLHNYELIGLKLIEDRLLLSALELYAELAEAGHEILSLKQFFSNPGNFEKTAKTEVSRLLVRSLSQATLDSLDFAPLSEDGDRTGEERVAVLEFELRKARETITALRENLTFQVEQENASNQSETGSNGSNNKCKWDQPSSSQTIAHQSISEPIRAYEQRAINFLVHEYLLTHGYRLTSITLADENAGQDFENWEDVGLNTERPADLLNIFRQVHRSRPGQVLQSSVNAETQTNEDEALTISSSSLGKAIDTYSSSTAERDQQSIVGKDGSSQSQKSTPVLKKKLQQDVVYQKLNQFTEAPFKKRSGDGSSETVLLGAKSASEKINLSQATTGNQAPI